MFLELAEDSFTLILGSEVAKKNEAEVEAENEEEAWELVNDNQVEFEFLQSDDEFIVHKKK